jgi:RNA polymerase sigma-70 factor (ECF subfamily)
MPPSSAWFQGREAIRAFFAARVFTGTAFALEAIWANGQPAFAAYIDIDGTLQAHAIHVLTVEDGQLAGLTTFLNPALFPYFGLPDQRPN